MVLFSQIDNSLSWCRLKECVDKWERVDETAYLLSPPSRKMLKFQDDDSVDSDFTVDSMGVSPQEELDFQGLALRLMDDDEDMMDFLDDEEEEEAKGMPQQAHKQGDLQPEDIKVLDSIRKRSYDDTTIE